MGEPNDPSVKKRSLSSYLSNVSSRREELEQLKKRQEEEKLEEQKQEEQEQRQKEEKEQERVRAEQQNLEKNSSGSSPQENQTNHIEDQKSQSEVQDKAHSQRIPTVDLKDQPVEDSQSPPKLSKHAPIQKESDPKSSSLTRSDLHSMLKEPGVRQGSDDETLSTNVERDHKNQDNSNDDDEDVESDAPTEPASPPRPRRGRLIRGDRLQSMSPSHPTFDNGSDSELSDIDELKSIHISSSIIHGDSSPVKSTQEDVRRKQQASSPRIDRGRSASSKQLKPNNSASRVSRQKKGVYRDAGGRTRLQISCDKGNYDQAKKLIEEENYDVNDQDNAGNTALHEAALNGHLDVVKLLTKNGANVNIQSFEMFKDTPLIDASANGHLDVVKYLLSHGADPTICNAKGLTAYESIEEDSDLDEQELEIVSEIKKHLRSAAKNLKSDKAIHNISSMKEKHSQRRQLSEELLGDFEFFWTDITSRAGKQKLFKASKEGKLSYVGSYLENGGRVDLRSFFEAVKLGHEDVTSLFLAFGAQVNAVSNEGTTALISAVGRGHVGTVKLLLEAGADPRRKDKNGHNALFYAENSPMGVVDNEEISLIRKALQDSGASVKDIKEESEKDQETVQEKSGNPTKKHAWKREESDEDDDENVISVGRKRRTISPERYEAKRQAPSVPPISLDESLEQNEASEGESKKPSLDPETAKIPEETAEEREQRLKAEEEYIQRRLQNKKKKEQELLRKLALDEEKREKERAEQKIKEAEKMAERERLREMELDNRKKELELLHRREIRSLYPLGLRLIDFNDSSDQENFLPLYYVEIGDEKLKYVLDLQLCVILKNPGLISKLTDIEKIPVAAKHKRQLWNILKPTFLYGGPKNRHLLNWGALDLQSQMQFEIQECRKFTNLPMHWVRIQDIEFDVPEMKQRIEQSMIQIALVDASDETNTANSIKQPAQQATTQSAHMTALPNKFQKRQTVSQLLQDYNSRSLW